MIIAQSQAEVRHDANVVSAAQIAKSVSGLGYKCQHMKMVGPRSEESGPWKRGGSSSVLDVKVTGMSCTSCSGKVERAILALPGISYCSVSVSTVWARVSFAPVNSGGGVGMGALSSSSDSGDGGGNEKSRASRMSRARDVVKAVEALGFGA